jgi:hypothetical protein
LRTYRAELGVPCGLNNGLHMLMQLAVSDCGMKVAQLPGRWVIRSGLVRSGGFLDFQSLLDNKLPAF